MASPGGSPALAAVLLTGTVGAGKTTTAAAIGDRLGAAGNPHAVLDLDWLRRSWPAPADDPFNSALELQNLAAVSGNFVRAGARKLVLAGVLESEGDRADYETAVGMPLVVCRLRVDLDRVRSRLVHRHEPGTELDWHLTRSGELESRLEAEGVGDHVLDVTTQTPDEVAAAVLRMIGWERRG